MSRVRAVESNANGRRRPLWLPALCVLAAFVCGGGYGCGRPEGEVAVTPDGPVTSFEDVRGMIDIPHYVNSRSDIVRWADAAVGPNQAALQSIGSRLLAVHWIYTSGRKSRVVLIYSWQWRRAGGDDPGPWKLERVLRDDRLGDLAAIVFADGSLKFLDERGQTLYSVKGSDISRSPPDAQDP